MNVLRIHHVAFAHPEGTGVHDVLAEVLPGAAREVLVEAVDARRHRHPAPPFVEPRDLIRSAGSLRRAAPLR